MGHHFIARNPSWSQVQTSIAPDAPKVYLSKESLFLRLEL